MSKASGGHSCSVALCRNTSINAKSRGLTIRFFTFPRDCKLRREWIVKCRRQDSFNPDTARICSQHFTEDDYEDAVRAKVIGEAPKKLKKTGEIIKLITTNCFYQFKSTSCSYN